jgi:hypothetical protein
MHTTPIATSPQGFASTHRVDRWWVAPALTALGLVVFFGYLTLRAFNGTYVWYDPYISPTVAPPLFTPVSGYPGAVPVEHAWFGAFPTWWPPFLPQSPAFFRLDCFTCDGAVSPRYRLWKGSSWLNVRHMRFAWLSLVWVVFTDVYIYLVSTGTIRDLNTW